MDGSRENARSRGSGGYTLVELAITFAVVGALSSVAIVHYFGYVEKARVARAVAEIESISRAIDARVADGESDFPDSLSGAEAGHMFDPWGNPYRYLKISGRLPKGLSAAPSALPPVAAPPGGGPGGGGGSIMGEVRKDQFLVPINSDYDLYSMGADGESKPNLNNKVSRDDVVRARDGAYVGLAEYF
jgi:general secretion pathway protein G